MGLKYHGIYKDKIPRSEVDTIYYITRYYKKI